MWFLKARYRKAHNHADVPQVFAICSPSLTCHKLRLRGAESQMNPCTFLAKTRKVGLFDKEGANWGKKTAAAASLSNECCGEILLCAWKFEQRWLREGTESKVAPLLSSQSSTYNTWAKSGRGSRDVKAASCLFWGMVFKEGRQRKETARPQSWSTHPPGGDLYLGTELRGTVS